MRSNKTRRADPAEAILAFDVVARHGGLILVLGLPHRLMAYHAEEMARARRVNFLFVSAAAFEPAKHRG